LVFLDPLAHLVPVTRSALRIFIKGPWVQRDQREILVRRDLLDSLVRRVIMVIMDVKEKLV